jgi:hypothetical protein
MKVAETKFVAFGSAGDRMLRGFLKTQARFA